MKNLRNIKTPLILLILSLLLLPISYSINSTELISLYRFEEGYGYIAVDTIGTNNGSLYNEGNYTESYGYKNTGNYSLNFNGVDDWINISNLNNDYTFGDGAIDSAFSGGLWVYMDDATKFRMMGTLNSLELVEWGLFIDGNDALEIKLFDDDTSSYVGRKTNNGYMTAFESTWTFIVFTYDGSGTPAGFDIYINAVESDSSDISGVPYTAMHDKTDFMQICNNLILNASVSSFCKGKLDEIFIIDREMTQGEVTYIFNNGWDSEVNATQPPPIYETGFIECPTNTPLALILIAMVGLALVFIIIGIVTPTGIFGFLGAIMLLIISLTLTDCYALVGTMIALISVMLVLYFALFKNTI